MTHQANPPPDPRSPIPVAWPSPPDSRALLALWEQAQAEVRRRCAATLRRLRQGQGGFYAEDDFWQDLFVEFLTLARRASSPDDLWAEWRRMLLHGGKRIVGRAPQRLWLRVEETYDPAALTLELDAPDAVAERSGALPQAVRAALSAPAEAERAVEGLAALDELEAGLAALRPSQRQLLYMTVVQGWPSSELAALCGVSAADAVRQRLRLARAALRRGRG